MTAFEHTSVIGKLTILIPIYHHLYYEREWKRHEDQEIDTLPDSQNIYVEGLPGTGKTFIIKTLRNMIRKIHKSNHCDIASAPTGCATALINGSTHARSMSLPVEKKQHNAHQTSKIPI